MKGKITVVVSSIEESSEDQPSDTAADVETGDESSEASVPDDTTSDNKDTDIKSDDEAVPGENQQNDSEASGRQKIRLRMRKTSRTVKQIRKKKPSRALLLPMKQNLKRTPKLLELQPRQKKQKQRLLQWKKL